MKKSTLPRNASMAVMQVIVSGVVLFFLYRYLLKTIGVEMVGVWAVVLATVSASRISDLGFVGSTVKFTAKYLAQGDRKRAADVIQTSLSTIAVVLGGGLWLGHDFIAWLMGKFIPQSHIIDAVAVLPYALLSAWVGAIAAVFASGLEGCQRIDVRVTISLLGNVFFLFFVWMFLPQHGLIGLAWAQIGQGLFLLLGNFVMLRRQLTSLPLLPVQWSYTLFREMLRYGVNFQAVSFFSMMFDPVTKALMAKFGGLDSTAYYEMASRMVMQFRMLLISANQVVVPKVAEQAENAPDGIINTYLSTYGLVFFISSLLFTSLAASVPLISDLWLGQYNQHFVEYSLLLALGYWFNSLVGPAYFVNLGTGHLQWNTVSHVVIGILNLFMSYMLGLLFGGLGVALGYVLALIAGCLVIIVGSHRDYQIPMPSVIPRESRHFFIACMIGLLNGWLVFHCMSLVDQPFDVAKLSLITCLALIALAAWRHPLRQSIYRQMLLAGKDN